MQLDRLLSLWWLPEKPDEQLVGQITVDPDGKVDIEIAGTLGGGLPSFDAPEPPILYGLGTKGPFFTARRLVRSGGGMGMPGFPTERFRPLSVIVGANVDESTRYHQALLQTSFLADWLQESGIRIDITQANEQTRGSVGVRYEWPEVRAAHVDGGLTVSTWTAHQGVQSRSGYQMNEDVALKIELETPLSIDELITDCVMPLLDLISIGTAHSNAVDRVTVRSPEITNDALGQAIDLEFLTEWVVGPQERDARLHPHNMNFTAGEAPLGFEALVQRWFSVHKDLRPALAPYFGLLYAPPTYVDLRLVSISQALEAYHRASNLTRAAMPKDQFAALKKLLLAACPAQHRPFIEQKMGYLNEKTQVERTNDLVELTKLPLGRMFQNRPTFAVDFIEARNAKTHPEHAKADVDSRKLYDLTRTATYVFEACIMLELGFDASACKDLFERQPEYMHFAQETPP